MTSNCAWANTEGAAAANLVEGKAQAIGRVNALSCSLTILETSNSAFLFCSVAFAVVRASSARCFENFKPKIKSCGKDLFCQEKEGEGETSKVFSSFYVFSFPGQCRVVPPLSPPPLSSPPPL